MFSPKLFVGTRFALDCRIIMESHILIIDDNTQELRKLREILTREGYNIMTATDYSTAMQIYNNIPVNIVLAKAPVLGFPKQSFTI